MSKRFLITVVMLLAIAGAAALAVFLAKGYTFSPRTGKIVGTGIISATSQPEGASVFIDGHLTSATNATVSNLPPKEYDVKIVKEGFIPWEKKVTVREGLVTELKVTLFPAIPTIYPLTYNGVVNPLLSPDGQRLAFEVPTATVSSTVRQKGGVWVWTLVSQPISFARSAEPHQLVASTPTLDFSKAVLRFSPDSKQLLATLQENGNPSESFERNYLLDVTQTVSAADLRDITPTVGSLLKSWDEEQKQKDAARVLTISDLKYQKIASDSAKVIWSPDETKLIYSQDGKTNFNVVDFENLRTERSFQVPEHPLPAAKAYYWLPDSRHVILVEDGKISIADLDGTNSAVIYAGTFQDSFVFPWPDSSRLVIITSFPTPTASQPNFYGINLK